MNRRALVFAVAVLACAAVNGLMACAPIRYPSCGEYHFRATDGATCRECLDAKGSYAQCSK